MLASAWFSTSHLAWSVPPHAGGAERKAAPDQAMQISADFYDAMYCHPYGHCSGFAFLGNVCVVGFLWFSFCSSFALAKICWFSFFPPPRLPCGCSGWCCLFSFFFSLSYFYESNWSFLPVIIMWFPHVTMSFADWDSVTCTHNICVTSGQRL